VTALPREPAPPPAAGPPEPEPPEVTAPAGGPSAPELTAALLRGAYGLALCCAPGLIIRLAGGVVATPGDRAVGRVLGVRHVAQAVVSLARPTPAVLALGAGADVLHSASMVALAALDRPRRRLGCTDALIAAAFAAAGGTLAARRAAAAGPAPETAALPALPLPRPT
jgi:hypothetical protein